MSSSKGACVPLVDIPLARVYEIAGPGESGRSWRSLPSFYSGLYFSPIGRADETSRMRTGGCRMPPDTERESIPAAVNLPPVFLLENTACAACGAASGLVRQQASYF